MASVLKSKFNGSVLEMVASAKSSAERLLSVVTDNFPCFRDCAEMPSSKDGRDPPVIVSLHKRAQIFIADLWSLFEGKGPAGRFDDIESITMFADYRVPQSLQYFGAMKYSDVSSKRQFIPMIVVNIVVNPFRNCLRPCVRTRSS